MSSMEAAVDSVPLSCQEAVLLSRDAPTNAVRMLKSDLAPGLG